MFDFSEFVGVRQDRHLIIFDFSEFVEERQDRCLIFSFYILTF